MISLIKRTKNFLQKKFKKDEELYHEKDANEQIYEFVISRLKEVKTNPKEMPEGLSKEDWQKLLSSMIEGWDSVYENTVWKTKSRERNKKLKISTGFNLFSKYYKNIK